MIIFDVGANNGDSCVDFCKQFENTVYAFEPTPHLVTHALMPKSLVYKNFIVIPKAVGKEDGKTTFNIAGHHNWGCSSLYEFNDNLQETWPGRKDFYFNDKVEVDVICMETFLQENDHIKQIDFFHCDTQGNDMNVLEGFGKHINKIKKGQIEVSAKNPLYKNCTNTLEAATLFLNKNGFEIYDLHRDGPEGNEINVRFINKN